MIRFRLLPAALALLALAGCGKKDDGAAPTAKATPVAAVAPPAGMQWSDKIEATDKGVRMGNPDAAIRVIEYGSFTCPHCRDFQAEAHEEIVKDYVDTGRVSFEYRNLVRDPIDATVAILAHCEGPEPYFALTTLLFANQNPMIDQIRSNPESAYQAAMSAPPEQRFIKLAELGGLIEWGKQHGIPEDKAKTCLANQDTIKQLSEVTQEAADKYHVEGTPSFIVNGILLENTASWPTLKAKLKDMGV